MNRRKFLKAASGLFIPISFGIIRAAAQMPVIPLVKNQIVAAGGGSPWALVHYTQTNAAQDTITIPSTGAGNLVVVAISMAFSSTCSGITDNAGGGSNTYAHAGTNYRASLFGAGAAEVWYAKNSSSGATVITMAGVSGTTQGISVWEVSGLNASSPFDISASVTSSSSLSTQSGAAVTTSAAGDFVAGTLSPSSNVSGEAGGDGFTLDGIRTGDGAGNSHLTSTSAMAGTYTPQWTLSPAGTMAAVSAAFKL